MINSKEQLMYEVMKAIYEQDIPVCFKGSMVLKACLLEAGYAEEVRHTADIDANWNSDNPPAAWYRRCKPLLTMRGSTQK